jgi:hypothetical protein
LGRVSTSKFVKNQSVLQQIALFCMSSSKAWSLWVSGSQFSQSDSPWWTLSPRWHDQNTYPISSNVESRMRKLLSPHPRPRAHASHHCQYLLVIVPSHAQPSSWSRTPSSFSTQLVHCHHLCEHYHRCHNLLHVQPIALVCSVSLMLHSLAPMLYRVVWIKIKTLEPYYDLKFIIFHATFSIWGLSSCCWCSRGSIRIELN